MTKLGCMERGQVSGIMMLRYSEGRWFSRAKTQEEGSLELGYPGVSLGLGSQNRCLSCCVIPAK